MWRILRQYKGIMEDPEKELNDMSLILLEVIERHIEGETKMDGCKNGFSLYEFRYCINLIADKLSKKHGYSL